MSSITIHPTTNLQSLIEAFAQDGHADVRAKVNDQNQVVLYSSKSTHRAENFFARFGLGSLPEKRALADAAIQRVIDAAQGREQAAPPPTFSEALRKGNLGAAFRAVLHTVGHAARALLGQGARSAIAPATLHASFVAQQQLAIHKEVVRLQDHGPIELGAQIAALRSSLKAQPDAETQVRGANTLLVLLQRVPEGGRMKLLTPVLQGAPDWARALPLSTPVRGSAAAGIRTNDVRTPAEAIRYIAFKAMREDDDATVYARGLARLIDRSEANAIEPRSLEAEDLVARLGTGAHEDRMAYAADGRIQLQLSDTTARTLETATGADFHVHDSIAASAISAALTELLAFDGLEKQVCRLQEDGHASTESLAALQTLKKGLEALSAQLPLTYVQFLQISGVISAIQP